VPHYGALDAICPETQFRLSHQSATGQEKLALANFHIKIHVPVAGCRDADLSTLISIS
jgi:hypothetical protein